jgi:uncharacterized membrane protein YeiH
VAGDRIANTDMDTPPLTPATLLLTLDILGTFVFAMSGAAAGVKKRLDVFGVCVLAFVAATAGGLIRDVLIGAVPPAGISDWRYIATSLAAGAVTFLWYPRVQRLNTVILVFDAAGLGLFAVVGTEKALAYGLNAVASGMLGMLSGIGGGLVRDVLVNEVPVVLRADLYAVAALAGAAVVVLGAAVHVPSAVVAPAGAALCFLMRLVAIRRRVNLPVAGEPT